MDLESTPRWFDTLRGLGSIRRQERVAFEARAQVLPLDGRRQSFWGSAVDLSERGMFVTTSEALPLDSLAVLRLRTSAGELRLSVRVVHRVEGFGFGCELVDLDERQREAVAFLVALARFHARAAAS